MDIANQESVGHQSVDLGATVPVTKLHVPSGPGLQQTLLQIVASSPDLQVALRRMASAIYPALNAVQIWYCQRGESSGQVMLDRLLDLETEEVLEQSLPNLALDVDRLAECCLQQGKESHCGLLPHLALYGVPVFFIKQRPAALVALCLDHGTALAAETNQEQAKHEVERLESQSSLSLLQLLASQVTLWHAQRNVVSECEAISATAKSDSGDIALSRVLTANLREIMNSTSRIQACSLLCTRFAGFLNASHLAAFSLQNQRDVRLAGFSGTAHVDQSSQLFQCLHGIALQMAASENRSPNGELTWITSEDEGLRANLLKQAANHLRVPLGLACSIRTAEGVVGVSLLFGGESLRKTVSTEGFAAQLSAVNDQLGCAMHWHDSAIRRTIRRVWRRLETRKRWIATGLGILGLVSVMPFPYQMNCHCQLTPTEKRFVVAPFEGRLNQVMVEPGQMVAEGQVLATMDDRDLQLELAARQSEYEREVQKSQAGRAAGNLADAKIAELESQRIQQQMNLLNQRLQRQELRSPQAGTLVHGDLRKLQGAPVEIGQELFEIASLDQLIVEVEIPEYQYRYVRVGQETTIRLEAYPFDQWTGKIAKLKPSAEPRNGQNVFVAEVQIANQELLLRPGMKGSAMVQGQYYPLAWNWLHYPYEKTQQAFRWLW